MMAKRKKDSLDYVFAVVKFTLKHWRFTGPAAMGGLIVAGCERKFGTWQGGVWVLAFVAAAIGTGLLAGKVAAYNETGHPVPNPFKLLWQVKSEQTSLAPFKANFRKAMERQGLGWGSPKEYCKPENARVGVDGTITGKIKPGKIGGSVYAIKAKEVEIGGILGCDEFKVIPDDDRKGEAFIKAYKENPLKRIFNVREIPMPDRDEQLAFGIDRDRRAATIEQGFSLIIGGESGSGKSGILWAIIADLVRRGIHVRLWVCDPKGGLELGALAKQVVDDPRGRTGTLTVRKFARTQADIKKLIVAFERSMQGRQDAMREGEIRKVSEATAEYPLEILIIDEFLSLDKDQRGTDGPLGRIVSQIRACLGMVIALAQIGEKGELGASRDLFQQVIVLRTHNAYMTQTFIGQSEAVTGAYCSLIPKAAKGVGYYLSHENNEWVRFRGGWVADEDTFTLAKGQVLKGTNMERGALVFKRQRLYRAWDANGRLLYVGVTDRDPQVRWDEHRRDDVTRGACRYCGADRCRWWYEHVAVTEADEAVFKTRADVLAAEKKAVQLEMPLMNVVHNRGSVTMRRLRSIGHRTPKPPTTPRQPTINTMPVEKTRRRSRAVVQQIPLEDAAGAEVVDAEPDDPDLVSAGVNGVPWSEGVEGSE